MGAIMQDRVARYLERIERPDETLDEIVQRMTGSAGSYEGLPAICRAWDVPYGKVIGWLMADAERYAVYDRALAFQAKALVSEAVEIADTEPAVTEKGGVDAADVAHRKLQIETRFRLAKYHDSKVYGDKVDVNHNVAPVFIINAAPDERQERVVHEIPRAEVVDEAVL
jgi:hypothetical protein